MDLIITILPVVTKNLPISPRFTPYNFLSRCKFSPLTTRQPMVEFYLLTFPHFPLRKNKILLYHSKTEIPSTLYYVSFKPGLGFNIFLFHVIQENYKIVLNRSVAHLMGGRLTFPHKKNISYVRSTRVPSGQNIGRSIALATFEGRWRPPSSVFASPPPLTAVLLPVVHPNEFGARNEILPRELE